MIEILPLLRGDATLLKQLARFRSEVDAFNYQLDSVLELLIAARRKFDAAEIAQIVVHQGVVPIVITRRAS